MVFDQFYMVEGGVIYFQKDLVVNNNKYVIWWLFVNLYEDGSWEVGFFMVGYDYLGYVIFSNDKGEVCVIIDIEGQVRYKEGSYFFELVWIVIEGEEEWEFLFDFKGEMIDFVGGFFVIVQQEGCW